MRTVLWLGCVGLLIGCGDEGPTGIVKFQARDLPPQVWTTDYCASEGWYGDKECDEFCPTPDPDCDPALERRAQTFIDAYVKRYAEAERALLLADWKASSTGAEADYQAVNAAAIQMFLVNVDKTLFAELEALLAEQASLTLFTRRTLLLAQPGFIAMKLGGGEVASLLKILNLRNEALATFNNYAATVDGEPRSITSLREMLGKETDPARRRTIWEALKAVGPRIAPSILEGVKTANRVARAVGFATYRDYALKTSELDPAKLAAIFDDVDRLTAEPYARVKQQIDGEVASRFGISAGEVAIWHYSSEFFMDAPPSPTLNLDTFFKDSSAARIVEIASRFFGELGLDVGDVLERSDLYPRQGKWPGAQTTPVDRGSDIRVLMNARPDHDSVATALHELGHAVDMKNLDAKLPFMLRSPNHIFTTEAVALLFEAQAMTPSFYLRTVRADPGAVQKVASEMIEQQRRGDLVFARYCLTMFHFEKALYENPDQDLDKLWWDLAERYQLLRRPAGHAGADWASKTHFASSPVYYHNYMLGKLLGAQLREEMARRAGWSGPILGFSLLGQPGAIDLLKKKVFRVGQRMHWSELVQLATFAPLGADRFGAQMGAPDVQIAPVR